MPKILTEMKNVGKHLRATHHLYFQTSFLRRTVDKNVFAGVPCKKIALANLRVPIYSRIHDKNLVITYWSGGVLTPIALNYGGLLIQAKKLQMTNDYVS